MKEVKNKINDVTVADVDVKHTLYTYRYLFRSKDMQPNNLGIKVFTGTLSEHEKMCRDILNDEDIISCLREYVHEIDLNLVLIQRVVKKEVKEEENKNEA